MSKSYYGDLSGESSDDDSSSSDEDPHDSSDIFGQISNNVRHRRHLRQRSNDYDVNHTTGLWDKSIIHLDVDCFYCQSVMIDSGFDSTRPLAIGQKHIIVTCNYAARRRGVQKLQSRDSAMAACPDLCIVEGSDLQRFRFHSRKIYESFRTALSQISIKLFTDTNEEAVVIPAKKGTMDEMVADLSVAVSQMIKTNCNTLFEKTSRDDDSRNDDDDDQDYFLYGETADTSTTTLVEDQTGQKAVVSYNNNMHQQQQQQQQSRRNHGLFPNRRNVHESFGNESDRQQCSKRLKVAALQLASFICCHIQKETGFHTTAGVSVSPLLAKIASDLNKPKSINILYPWRSSQLIYCMPLRKMNLIGYGTVKALKKTINTNTSSFQQQEETTTNSNKNEIQTVRDLLEMPRNDILRSLQGMQAFQSSSEEKTDFLINRCRGIDDTEIIDDEGETQKTLSIENSFRTGTVRTMEGVWRGLLDLFVRLPLLLRDRASWSCNHSKAYPTTIRLTVRLVDNNLTNNNTTANRKKRRRRPFVTNSKQAPINGKRLLEEKDSKVLIQILKQSISPLLNSLLSGSEDINITRMNIALTNFQDITATSSHGPGSSPKSAAILPSKQFFLPKKRSSYRIDTDKTCHGTTKKLDDPDLRKAIALSLQEQQRHKQDFHDTVHNKQADPDVTVIKPLSSYGGGMPSLSLPPVKSTSNKQPVGRKRTSKSPRMRSTRIDHFFWKK